MTESQWATVASAVLLAVVAMLRQAWMKSLAQRAAREIAEREMLKDLINTVTGQQHEIVLELRNHMSGDRVALDEIREHMGAEVEALRGIRDLILTMKN